MSLPEPAAMRFLREPSTSFGNWRSLGVMELMIATNRVVFVYFGAAREFVVAGDERCGMGQSKLRVRASSRLRHYVGG